MTTILLTGMPGCGKEEFIKIVLKQGYDIVRMGDVVREHADRAGEEDIGTFANSQREEHHKAIWAQRTTEIIESEDTVIDGVRSLHEVRHFKKHLGTEFEIVAVHASPATRFHRLVARGRTDAPATEKDFLNRDKRELSWGIGDVIARADIMLVNEDSLEHFHDMVRAFFNDGYPYETL